MVVVEGYGGGAVPPFVTRVDPGGPAQPCTIVTPEVAVADDGTLIASGRLTGDCGPNALVDVSVDGLGRLDLQITPDVAGHFALPVPGELPLDAAVEMAVSVDDTVVTFEGTLQALNGQLVVMPERAPVAPVAMPEGLEGTWLLSTLDVDTGRSNAPKVAGASRIADDTYAFWSRCEPDEELATATVQGDGVTLRAPDGTLLGVGDVDGQRLAVMREDAEARNVLEAVRIDDIDCEARQIEPRFFTPFDRDSAPAEVVGIGLDPWAGFVLDDEASFEAHDPEIVAVMPEGPQAQQAPTVEYLLDDLRFVPPAGNGMQHLRAASTSGFAFGPKSQSEHEDDDNDGDPQCERTDDGSFDAMPCPGKREGAPSHQKCTTSQWKDEQVIELSDAIALVGDPNVYPGALLQGAYLGSGAFTPITIPRSGGRFHVTGVSMADPAIAVNEVTGANVEAARQTLLRRPIQSTGAAMSWRSIDVYSYEHLLVQLGVNAKWPGGKLKADFDFSRSNSENYVLVKFTQRFYDMVYQPPAQPQDAFFRGAAFNDPGQQIGAGNRPVYVGRVGYGRQLFLLVRAKHSRQDIKASLKAAFNNVSGSAKAKASSVLDSAEVTFIAYGGDAVRAAAPLASVNAGRSKVAGAMFGALADVARHSSNLTASPSNAAAPISYGLYDLITHRPVQLGYSVVTNRRDCVTVDGRDYTYELHVLTMNDALRMWVDHETNQQLGIEVDTIHPGRSGYGASALFKLNPIISRLHRSNDRWTKLMLEHDNHNCGARFAWARLLVDGKEKWEYYLPNDGWGHCGTYMESDIYVDPTTGEVNVTRMVR